MFSIKSHHHHHNKNIRWNALSVNIGDHHLQHGINLTNAIYQRFGKFPPSRIASIWSLESQANKYQKAPTLSSQRFRRKYGKMMTIN